MEPDLMINKSSEKYHSASFANQYLLKHHLNKTIHASQLKSASIHLLGNTEYPGIPSEIQLGQQTIDEQRYHTFPIVYQSCKIADLRLCGSTDRDTHSIVVPQLTRKIALIFKRFQATELNDHYLGQEHCLAGYSDHLLELEAFIERAANSKCPVVIGGEYGTEKLAVAFAIHRNSQAKDKPFIEVPCSSSDPTFFQRQLLRGIKRAQGGVIFVNGVDELSRAQQDVLTEVLCSRARVNCTSAKRIDASNVRFLVATSQAIDKLVQQSLMPKKLASQLDFLDVWIQPLRARKEDIPSIVDKLLNKHRVSREQSFTTPAIALLKRYHWPENYLQLERLVARLLALSSHHEIGSEDVRSLTPEVLTEAPEPTVGDSFGSGGAIEPQALVNVLLEKQYEPLKHYHPGLQKALKYLAEHYSDEVSLGALSENAFISPSHLSHLFKRTLNLSFKQLLAKLRVEQSTRILKSFPNTRITDVALEVGFGDLSHFEKIFKRITNVTPREYKKICKANI